MSPEAATRVNRQFACSFGDWDTVSDDDGSAESLFLLPDKLHEFHGITGEYIYTGEVFSNIHGGLNTNQATRYRGNLDLVLTAETDALDLWKSGRFFLYAGSMHGRTLTPEDVGDYQYYSNLEGSPRPNNVFQVNEYWYEHAFFGGDMIVKAGKQDAYADFAYLDLGGDFINTSFAWNPTVPLPTWPNPGIGAAVFLEATDLVHLKAGIYDGSPTFSVETGGQWGFSTLGRNGLISIFEGSLTPRFGEDDDLPGTYRFGAWYHTGDFDNLTTGIGTLSGSHGFYCSGDQLLWKEPDTDEDPQGLGAFLQYGWTPKSRSALHHSLVLGLTYRGPIKERNADIVGVGMANAFFSDRSLKTEQAIELFYKAQINDWMILQPDIQYIAGPSGFGRDAMVVGIRTEMVF